MAPLSVSEVQALCQRPQEVTAEELGQVLEAFREESTRLEAARLLRNCCALNPRVKEALGREDNLDAVFGVLKEELKECDGESASEAKLLRLRCCLQFLSNLSNGRAPLLARVARDLAPELTSCLAAPDAKARNFAASVVLLLAKSGSASVAAPEVVSRLCECVRSEESEAEFALFALHAVLAECAEALAGTFASLPRLDRLTLIDVAGAKKEEVFGGPGGPDLLTLLLEYYKRQAAQILTTLKSQSVELDPGEFTRLLALFCQLSGGDLCRQRLQADKSLLIDTVYLLRMIHDLGKESGSDGGLFAPARKVRLVGNLCYEHLANKHSARELDALPLLLDCTTLDGKNPLMTEWVVVALRALCKDCPENQAVVAGVADKGLVNVELAEEFGVGKAVEKLNLDKGGGK